MKRGAAIACVVAAALLPHNASAQAVALAPSGRIAVAHDSVIELFAADAKTRIWSAEGLPYVSTLAVGATKLAVVDAVEGRVVVADLADGHGFRIQVEGTPIDALFVGDDLYLLQRDASALERISSDGTRTSAPTGRYPQFLRRSGRRLLVYAADGTLDEFTADPVARAHSVAAPPFATDLETDGRFAYLVDPDDRKLLVFSLDPPARAGERTLGGFPIDLAVLSGPEAAAPGQGPYDSFAYKAPVGQGAGTEPKYDVPPAVLVVADPASASIVQFEVGRPAPEIGSLVPVQALAFGGPRRVRLPTAVDRVVSAGRKWVGYDSASRVLYSLVDGKAAPIAHDVGPHAFQARAGTIAFWNGALVARKL